MPFSPTYPEESDDELAKIIESELPGKCDPSKRYDRLRMHSAEMASRWIGFASIKTIPCEALLANDAFRTLRVSINLTVDSVPAGTQWQLERAQLERLRLTADTLVSARNRDLIDSFVSELKSNFNI